MFYAAGVIAGLVLGGVIGYLKKRFIWEKYLRRADGTDAGNEAGALYGRMLASNVVNIATLAAVFFLRELMPFDDIAFLVGTAVGLTVMSHWPAAGKRRKSEREGER